MNSKYQSDLVVGCAFEKLLILFRDLDRMFLSWRPYKLILAGLKEVHGLDRR